MRVLLLLILMNAQMARAHVSSGCEGEAQTPAARIVKHIALGLEKRELTHADIEFMIGDEKNLRNPYLMKSKRVENLFLRNKLASYLTKIKPKDVHSVRVALGELIGQNLQRETQVAGAREATNFIFAYKDMSLKDVGTAFSTINKLKWQTTNNGHTQLVILDETNLRLKFFDPKQRIAIDVRDLAVTSDQVPLRTNIEQNHVVTLSQVIGGSEMGYTIHDIEQNQSGKISSLPSTVSSAHLIRGKNQTRFVIARTSGSFLIYQVNADLTLQEFNTHIFENEDFEILNSSEGDALVVAVGARKKNRILIFDPTSVSPAKEKRMGMEVLETNSTLLPGGNYAIAVRTTQNRTISGPLRYEFLTRSPSQIMRSEILKESAKHHDWHVTQDGRAIFPVIEKKESSTDSKSLTFQGHLHLFEPLNPVVESSKGVWAQITRAPETLLPTKTLIADSMLGKPSFFESSDGKLLVLIGGSRTARNPMRLEKYINIFEPSQKTTPIHGFPVAGNEHIDYVTMLYAEALRDFLFIVQREAKAEVYAHWQNTSLILSRPQTVVGPAASDRDGHVYLPMYVSDPTSPQQGFQLYRLTAAGVGEP